MKHNFRELKIWQKAIQLSKNIYTLTKAFPKEELFGLTNQLKRCSVSIPSNIAEGCGRNSDKQLLHFLNISMGSLFEMETQIILAKEFNFIDQQKSIDILKQIDDLEKMIFSFKKSLLKEI